ncbi:MAG TPA: hypothetical protein VH063_14065 [Gaiellaceae bacterium]|jgi:hypothetical protein|nr:hypothetical protein [Gaiellaceae bacterium]
MLLVAWVAYPVVALALSLGCGLLLELGTGRRLPGLLVAPAGFAAVVVVSSLTTSSSATAQLTTPLVVALAVAGVGLSLRDPRRPRLWPAVAALGVFAVFAAPIALSGTATFAGYITLDDTATWLALSDNAMTHGRDLSQLAPSSYQVVLHDYMSAGYPLGAFLPLGIGHQLTRTDSAWLFQPQIAFLASMLSLALYSLAEPLVRSRPLRAAAAFLGAQAALLFGYAFWSGIKEVTAALLVALLAALVAALPGEDARFRDAIPLAFAGAAMLDVLAIVGVVWFGGFAAIGAALVVSRHRRKAAAVIGVLAGAMAVLALPALLQAHAFLHVADSGDITSSGAAGLGNLLHPLSDLQVLGIWPTGDFRTRPQSMPITYVLLAATVLAVAAGLVASVRRRAFGLAIYVVAAGGGALAVVVLGEIGHGSPWLDGKALATASPAFVTGGIAGAAVLLERRASWRIVGGLAGVAIASGVLWSNALAYANVWLAPRSQLSELETIGHVYAGDGPTLMTEYQPYGVRHFLRGLDPEGASERRSRPVLLQNGEELTKGASADIDAFALGSVLVYRTLVLRSSPLSSRPPSVYQPVREGPYYEVWQRPEAGQTILRHLSLGTPLEPNGIPACSDVKSLGQIAATAQGTLIASERPDAVVVPLSSASRPPNWTLDADGTVVPHGSGVLFVRVEVPATGRYGVWLGGSFRDTVSISADTAAVGSRTAQLSENGQSAPFGSVKLSKGSHVFAIAYSRNRLRPGGGSYPFGIGPLELGSPAAQAKLVTVAPADAASLCGRSLDWIEAVTQAG